MTGFPPAKPRGKTMRTSEKTVAAPRVVLVSGATGGIGGAVVEELARDGVTVVLLGRDRLRLDAVMSEVRSRVPAPGHLLARVVDVTDQDAVDAVVAEVAAE